MTAASMINHFGWKHLPPDLQSIARPFSDLADRIVNSMPDNMNTVSVLRKLLEARDAAISAMSSVRPQTPHQDTPVAEAARKGYQEVAPMEPQGPTE